MTRNDQMRQQWIGFHIRYPEVWGLFEKFTLDRIRSGFKHYGAKSVMERVRWETSAGSEDEDYKINNNHTAFYARLFVDQYPQHSGFFRMREQISEYKQVACAI